MAPGTRTPYAKTPCPAPAVLRAAAVGDLPLDALARVERHVEACPPCQDALAAFDGEDDRFARGLRKTVRSARAPSPALEQLMRAAEAISRVAWAAPPAPNPPPPALGQYVLHEPLGAGGMGVVYRATHTRLNRPVAVKLLPPGRLTDAAAVDRFRREVETIAGLDHPNIVRATDANEVAGRHFLVMELVDGLDLARVVRRHGPLPVADACEAARQAALGLAHAHARGVVHRDVKPSNAMLTTAGTVKLLDLGLAHSAGSVGGEGLTDSGQVVGTADYMAPEQAADPRAAGPPADVYGLGCTLFFLLTGAPPFAGGGRDTPVKKLLAHAGEPPPDVRGRRREVPPGVAAVVARMLAKRPGDRFATAAEVADRLRPFAAAADLSGLYGRAAGRADPTGDRELPPAETGAGGRPAVRKLWYLAGLALACLGVWTAIGVRKVAVDGESLADQIAAERDQGRNGAKLLRAALGDFPLGYLDIAPVDGGLKRGPKDGEFVVEVAYRVKKDAYAAYLKSLERTASVLASESGTVRFRRDLGNKRRPYEVPRLDFDGSWSVGPVLNSRRTREVLEGICRHTDRQSDFFIRKDKPFKESMLIVLRSAEHHKDNVWHVQGSWFLLPEGVNSGLLEATRTTACTRIDVRIEGRSGAAVREIFSYPFARLGNDDPFVDNPFVSPGGRLRGYGGANNVFTTLEIDRVGWNLAENEVDQVSLGKTRAMVVAPFILSSDGFPTELTVPYPVKLDEDELKSVKKVSVDVRVPKAQAATGTGGP